jgi:hypothetical protein
MTMRDRDDDTVSFVELRDQIVLRRQGLVRRLDDGYQRIDQAIRDGADVGAWEDFWFQLLLEYERICDDLSLAA